MHSCRRESDWSCTTCKNTTGCLPCLLWWLETDLDITAWTSVRILVLALCQWYQFTCRRLRPACIIANHRGIWACQVLKSLCHAHVWLMSQTLKGAGDFTSFVSAPTSERTQQQRQTKLLRGRSERLKTQCRDDWSKKNSVRERGSNRGSTEEGRQKEILTKPRYTHKSPDTTRLLPVFYRAALCWRNSMTGQFLQGKIWSLSALPPLAPLSLLFSVYPTWYHSVTPAPGSFFHHPPPYLFPPRFGLFIGALHSTRHVSLPRFYPSSAALLIPSHLLSSALVPPPPPATIRFSSCSPRAVSSRCPISTYSSPFPSFFLIHFLSAIRSIHPSPLFYLCYIAVSLSISGFPITHSHFPHLYVLWPSSFSSIGF